MTSGLEKILDVGTECEMVPPTDLKAWNSILRNLGTMYVGSSLDALKEYITNAADGGAKNITIRLNRRGKNVSLMVVDDGNGMRLPESERELVNLPTSAYMDEKIKIKPDSILRLPKKIGDSAKLLDESTQGKKAIGALAWQTIGKKVTFASQKEGYDTVAWRTQYETDGTHHDFKTALATEKEMPELSDLITNGHGTTVVFEDINAGVMRDLHPRKMQRYFGSFFRDLVKDDEVSITIEEGRAKYVVEPEEYPGKILIRDEIETKHGPVKFEIYFNPNKRGTVHVKQGIQTLVDDITAKKSYLNTDAWSSGMFTGQIRADWINPAAGRQDMENDDKADVFFDVVNQYSGRLDDEIAKYKKDNDPVAKRHFYNAMTKAFAKMLRENPDLSDLLNGYRSTRRGPRIPGQPDETGYAPPVPTGPNKGTGTGKTRPPKNDPPEPDPENIGKPVDQTAPGTTPARKSFTLRFADEEMADERILSRYEEDMSLMIFNSTHHAYLAAMGDPHKKKMYMTALIGKELLGKIYKTPSELADEVIQFQQRFLDHFPLK